MTTTIFYSWQCDLAAGVTRNLIQRAFEAALKAVKWGRRNRPAHRELLIDTDTDTDTDTKGVGGSPANVQFVKRCQRPLVAPAGTRFALPAERPARQR